MIANLIQKSVKEDAVRKYVVEANAISNPSRRELPWRDWVMSSIIRITNCYRFRVWRSVVQWNSGVDVGRGFRGTLSPVYVTCRFVSRLNQTNRTPPFIGRRDWREASRPSDDRLSTKLWVRNFIPVFLIRVRIIGFPEVKHRNGRVQWPCIHPLGRRSCAAISRKRRMTIYL
jgi:hypothetical protein